MSAQINEFPPMPDVPVGQIIGIDAGTGGNVVFDLAPGATATEVGAQWFDSDALREAPEKIFRLDRGGELEEHRYYYKFLENGDPRFYPSITTLLSQVMPSGAPLESWRGAMSYLQGTIDFVFSRMFRQPGIMAQLYTQERAEYGTFMHGEFTELLITRSYSLDQVRQRLELFAVNHLLPPMFMDYVGSLQKNLLSMAQFMIDYDVKPLAVEIALLNEYDDEKKLSGYGTTLDLVAEMRFKGSSAKDVCITDFKSGKGFNEKNELQLHAQRDTWNKHFPELHVDRLFNWRPKDWQRLPTYEFKEQTHSKSAAKLYFILGQALIEDSKLDNTLTICRGIIDLTESKKNIKDNYESYTLAELVKQKTEVKDPEGTDGVDIEAVKQDSQEPEKQKSIKRIRKPADTEKKPATEKKETPGTVEPEKEEKPASSLKIGKNKRADLLNTETEF